MGMVMSTMPAVLYVLLYVHSAFIALSALGMTTMKLHAHVYFTISILAMMTSVQQYAYSSKLMAMVTFVAYLVSTTSTTFKQSKE